MQLLAPFLYYTLNIGLASAGSNLVTRRGTAQSAVNPELLAKRHNISCVGNTYDLELPLQSDWNPNTVSLQYLCAKSKYGGGPTGRNIGGWCDYNEIVFDYSDRAQVNPQLSNPRIHLGCRYRCFCNRNIPVERRTMQPKPSENQTALGVLSKQSSHTYEIQLDIVDDFTMPWGAKRGRRGTQIVPSLRITHVVESDQYEDLFSPRYLYTSQDLGNSIRCEGSLPTFSLPDPYEISDFQNLQQMCATQHDGGLLGANAGGFCYRSDAIENGGRIVWFSDEMTPRLDWTWGGGNFFAAASIRMHCIQHCRCTGPNGSTTDATYLKGLWRFVVGAQLAAWPSGQVDLVSAGKAPSVNILPAQHGPGSPSGTCGVNGDQFCPQPWPTSLLGPIPRAPPNASDIVRPGPNPGTNNNLTTCGNTCQGPQDCGGGDFEKACACAIPNEQDAKALGLDPVFPVAVCLVLMHSNFGGTGGLIGRSEESWRCLCNATFTHSECCRSKDGMVWM